MAWLEVTKKLLEEIGKMKPKDRLSYVSSLAGCNAIIARSVGGWAQWLADSRIMVKMTEEELKKIFQEFHRLTKGFLDLDLKVTEQYSKNGSEEEDNPFTV